MSKLYDFLHPISVAEEKEVIVSRRFVQRDDKGEPVLDKNGEMIPKPFKVKAISQAENDALETSINTSIDLNEIYEIATKELGMVYANKDQVLLYDKTESEYVRQYEDIPEY